VIAAFTVDVLIFTVKDSVEGQLLFTCGTAGAFFVVESILTRDGLRLKDGPATSWAVFLGIFRLDRTGVNYFVINIRCSNLGAKLEIIATLTVKASIRSIVVGKTVE